jgi:hypothetical protein
MALTTTYDQLNHLTPREKQYIQKHPLDALTIKKAKETALAETKRRFGRNGRNDKSDAFRHCFWSALLARDIGYANALEFTTAHESSPTNGPAEKQMDLYNNRVGLHIGRAKGADPILSARCLEALAKGQLKVLAN